jgi:hypothetical protein
VKVAGTAAERAGRILDRADDVLIPGMVRLVGDGVDRAGSAAKVFAAGIAARVEVPEPPAGQGWRQGGYLTRGARLGVSVAVAALVVSAVATTLQGPDRLRTGSPSAAKVPDVKVPAAKTPDVKVTIGPYPGDVVGTYLAYARSRLDQLTVVAPDADLFAVVSFSDYRTPSALLGLLADYRMHRVFIRVPPGGRVFEAPVRDPVADVEAAFAHAAVTAAPRTPEASAYHRRCACVFAAVVRAPAGRLARLAGTEGVRAVDVASPGSTMASAVFVPLLPDRR